MKTKYHYPEVSWDPETEHTVKNASVIENAMKNIVRVVYSRLRPPVKKVFSATAHPPTVHLYLDKRKKAVYGYVENGEIYLNVELALHLPDSRPNLVWTTAHEFAHLYLWSIGMWARAAVESGGFLPHKQTALEGLSPFTSTPPCGATPRDRRELARLAVRMADATALAWGFGYEYAHSLTPEALIHPKRRTDFLIDEVGILHRLLNERFGERPLLSVNEER